MAPGRTFLSPLLVGRDEILDLAERQLDEVAAGRGRLLLVAGEAGIGKTRLVGAIRERAHGRGFRLAASELAPQDQEVPAASFLDLARSMQQAPWSSGLGRTVLELAEQGPLEASPTRRLLVGRIVDVLFAVGEQPTMLWFEDLQWADELSLEIIADLARRTRDRPLLLVGAYRTDDVAMRSTFRSWRSLLLTKRIAEEVRLQRLTREQTGLVTALVAGTGLPAPRDVVSAVFERTDGVPLHIEELLGALGREALADGRAIRLAAVPETLEDATLQRMGRLSPGAQRIATAGAVIGRRFVPGVLAGILDVPVASLESPLAELVENGILGPPDDRGQYDYRHQLLRDALYRRVPPTDRRHLHARAAEFGAGLEGASEIHASLHYELAGLRLQAFRAALAGARAAARIGSHREAFDLYERAMRNLPDDLSAGEQARVLEEFGAEAAAIDDNATASALLKRARSTYLATGDRLAAAEIIAPLTAIEHLLGHGISDAEPLLRQALAEVAALPESVARQRGQGRLLAALATTYALAVRIDDVEATAGAAISIARDVDDLATELNALSALVMVRPFTGRIDEGFELAADVIRRAGAVGLDAITARAYRWAGSTASEVYEADDAERFLREGIEHAERAELGNHRDYMTAHLGLVLWQDGRWDEAEALAQRALADGRGGLTTTIAGLYVLGFVDLGRGRFESAQVRLNESLEIGERFGELLRLSAPLWGLAELALLRGRPDVAVEVSHRGRLESDRVGDTSMLLPFVVTGTRARLAVSDPTAAQRWVDDMRTAIARRPIAAARHALDHADGLLSLSRGLTGKATTLLGAAVTGWDERHRTWESTWGRLDLAWALGRANRGREATGVVQEAARVAAKLRSPPIAERADAISRSGRGRTPIGEPWQPLTVREFEVARKIAEGMTNAELARELGISPRTASAHVEHILAKLGATRRAEIGAWVATVRQRPSGAAPSPR